MKYNNCIVLLMGSPGVGKMTVAKVLSKKTNFRVVAEWFEPILKLFGDDMQVWYDLDSNAWKKLNEMDDLILSTIADVCPSSNSYIISQMMFDKDPYHKVFYDKVFRAAEKRKAHFFPVRLLCSEDELVRRVQSEGRRKYFKTMDAELSRKRSHEKEVFYSHHPNEVTIDTTNQSAEQVAQSILDAIGKRMTA